MKRLLLFSVVVITMISACKKDLTSGQIAAPPVSNDVKRENDTHTGRREYYKNVTAIGSTTGTEYRLVGQTTRVSNATTSGTFTKAVGHLTLKTPGNGNDWSWSLSIHTVADETGALTLDYFESLYFCK